MKNYIYGSMSISFYAKRGFRTCLRFYTAAAWKFRGKILALRTGVASLKMFRDEYKVDSTGIRSIKALLRKKVQILPHLLYL